MEGQISENPLAELIREISVKHLSGRLRVQQERVTVVVYFKSGELIYAASNVRRLRLREYLIKDNLISERVLSRFDVKRSDIALAKQLTAEKVINETQSSQLQLRQLADVLRLALAWTDGHWKFDSRLRLGEEVPFRLQWDSLLLDAGRRIPLKFATSRLPNAGEMIFPVSNLPQQNDLQPEEMLILSRLDVPTSIGDLIMLSGLPDAEALRSIYALALGGLVQRERWNAAFRDYGEPAAEPVATSVPEPTPEPEPPPTETEAESLERFLERLDHASTHYEVLNVGTNASPEEIKKSYYEVARRYHPDRFRKESDPAQNLRIESAFARVTQAYDTLRESGHRATYDSKLDALARARAMGESSKQSSPTGASAPEESERSRASNLHLTDVDRAELSFTEGLAAKQRGQLNTAIGMFSSAARLVPSDARYRAHYGQALASHASTRRLAEAELQAAVKIEPENVDYRVMLAELYRDLGFAVRAKAEVEKVLKMSPNNRKARQLLRRL